MNEVANNVRSGSRAGTLWGVAVLLLGMFCISVPFIPGLGVVLMVGIALIATGVAQFLYAFNSASFGEGILRFLFSILAVLAGASLVSQPGAGLLIITKFLAAWFLVDGLWTLFTAFRFKPANGWAWMAFSGAVSIMLGVMIYNRFPESALWLVGVLVGIRLVFAGMTMIMLGSVGKAVAQSMEDASD
jgi:uncharacterized membrane protein HdeD (DUF308 family)